MDMLRPVRVTNTYDHTQQEGWHHMFYIDTNNEPYAVVENQDGRVWCQNLDRCEYQFTDREHVNEDEIAF